MAGRYSIGRVSCSNDFNRLQRKVDDLYNSYNYQSNTSNFIKTSEIIDQNACVQRKLVDSLCEIAKEKTCDDPCANYRSDPCAKYRSDPCANYRSSSYTRRTSCSPCVPPVTRPRPAYCPPARSSYCPPPRSTSLYCCTTSSTPSSVTTVCRTTSPAPNFSATRAINSVAAAAASAAASAAANAANCAELELTRTIRRKNAEIDCLKEKYQSELCEVEQQLSRAKLDNCELQNELEDKKTQLCLEKLRADSVNQDFQRELSRLKQKLCQAELKLSCLEPKAEQARILESEIADLKCQISRIKCENNILADANELQAKLIKSRTASPCAPTSSVSVHHFSRPRSCSPPAQTTEITVVTSRNCSPVRTVCVETCRPAPTTGSSLSPLSPNNCTQIIRQESLINRFNNLFCRDRQHAISTLRCYVDNCELIDRIIFAAVQEAFSIAKRSFCDWKIKIRSTLCLSHCGPETLEEAVQNYVNRNVDMYDLPCMVSEVIKALNCNPKLCMPPCTSYSVISSFIREACRIAWEMSALAYPLDIAFAIDSECFDECRYRRSFDSDPCAPLVQHHVWPCLLQGARVISKGEARTELGASLVTTRSRCSSPVRTCITRTTSIRRSRSASKACCDDCASKQSAPKKKFCCSDCADKAGGHHH